MKAVNSLIKKRARPCIKAKELLTLLIITILIVPSISSHVLAKSDYESSDTLWKTYPYHPPGTDIVFPADEGAHDPSEFPIEWWYANFHLTGQTTGQEYGAFVAFFKIQTTIAEKKEIRIFSISDIATEKTYTNVKIGTLTANPDHLDLSFQYITDTHETDNLTSSEFVKYNVIPENEETTIETKNTESNLNSTSQNITMGAMQYETAEPSNTSDDDTNGFDEENSEQTAIHHDRWYTKSNDHGLLPFQYSLNIGGNSQQDHQPMKLIVDMDCLKKPLIVGGDGVIELGKNHHISYYYSLTKLAVNGTITVHGFTENVIGFSWIDHQWGDFLNQNPPYGLVVSYEWFSIKLNDNREILAGDTWDQKTGEKINESFSSGLNLIDGKGTLYLLKDYKITPESYWTDLQTNHIYASRWKITESSQLMNITVTPIYPNQIMRVCEDKPLLQQILEKVIPGASFWEGVCSVSGTINGEIVQGIAYVELTHRYNNIDQ